ncbi:hypothetical protein CM15mP5_1220 [bacterium]|nr:MAG: hypothetical protein CM15mP5_1220 [bacterium]
MISLLVVVMLFIGNRAGGFLLVVFPNFIGRTAGFVISTGDKNIAIN